MSAPAPTQKKTTPNNPLVPPDEQFWHRYSPHHEFPLSTISSLAIHALVFGLLLLAAVVVARLIGSKDKPLPVDAVQIVGGGGGDPNGVGGGPGDGDPAKGEAVENPETKRPVKNPIQLKDIDPGKLDPIQLPNVVDQNGTRLINPGTVVDALASVNEDARKKMWGNVAGKGQGGSGSGGGKDKGNDTGTGSGTGAGEGKLSQRQKRVLRWVMIFNTRDGVDYARQLAGLGAILAYPDPAMPDQYRVLRDLNARPARGEIEDLGEIKRIFWVDDKPGSVDSLSRALGVPRVPHFVAFFPQQLEEKLLSLELSYLDKTHPGKTEDDIEETRFAVDRLGGGEYMPRVTGLKIKAR